jgi:hypothetical protein
MIEVDELAHCHIQQRTLSIVACRIHQTKSAQRFHLAENSVHRRQAAASSVHLHVADASAVQAAGGCAVQIGGAVDAA